MDVKDFSRAKNLTENGLEKRSNYVTDDGIIEAIDIYTSLSSSKKEGNLFLFIFCYFWQVIC